MAETKTSDAPVSKNRLYVKWNIDEQILRSAFEAFGKVTDAHVLRGIRQRSDYGFITFESEDAAAKAMASLNGKTLVTSPLQIEFSQSEKPRERKPRAPRAPRQPAAAGAEKSESRPKERKERKERKEFVKSDYSSILAVDLSPDPTENALPATAKLVELKPAADRLFRSGRQEPQKGEFLSSLAFKPKAGAGGLNADIQFKRGADAPINLKVIAINVDTTKPTDTRVSATVAHPESGRESELYLRHFVDENNEVQVRHKFLELRENDLNPNAAKVDESKVDPAAKVDAFFVGLEKIILDRTTGLWSELVISLHKTKVLRRAPPRIETAAPGGADVEKTTTRSRRQRNIKRGPRRANGAGVVAASATTSTLAPAK